MSLFSHNTRGTPPIPLRRMGSALGQICYSYCISAIAPSNQPASDCTFPPFSRDTGHLALSYRPGRRFVGPFSLMSLVRCDLSWLISCSSSVPTSSEHCLKHGPLAGKVVQMSSRNFRTTLSIRLANRLTAVDCVTHPHCMDCHFRLTPITLPSCAPLVLVVPWHREGRWIKTDARCRERAHRSPSYINRLCGESLHLFLPMALAACIVALVALSTFPPSLSAAAAQETAPVSTHHLVKRNDAATGFIAALVILVFLLVAVGWYMTLWCPGGSNFSYNYSEEDASRRITGPSHWLYVLSRGRYGSKSQPPEILPEFELKSPVDSESQTSRRPGQAHLLHASSSAEFGDPSIGASLRKDFRERLGLGHGANDNSDRIPLQAPTPEGAQYPTGTRSRSRVLPDASRVQADPRAQLLPEEPRPEEEHRAVG